MSINSIDHDDMTNITHKWDDENGADSTLPEHAARQVQPDAKMKSAAARRRIEVLKEIKQSGLSIEEARDLGLLD